MYTLYMIGMNMSYTAYFWKAQTTPILSKDPLYSLHIYVYACMRVCVYICCIGVCMHACMYVCMYACMHACMHVHAYICSTPMYVNHYYMAVLSIYENTRNREKPRKMLSDLSVNWGHVLLETGSPKACGSCLHEKSSMSPEHPEGPNILGFRN